jgi:hypothetical protein
MKGVVLVYAEMRRHVAGQQSHSCNTTEREERCRASHIDPARHRCVCYSSGQFVAFTVLQGNAALVP